MNRRALNIQATGRAALEARERVARLKGVTLVEDTPRLVRIRENARHDGPAFSVTVCDGKPSPWRTSIVTHSPKKWPWRARLSRPHRTAPAGPWRWIATSTLRSAGHGLTIMTINRVIRQLSESEGL